MISSIEMRNPSGFVYKSESKLSFEDEASYQTIR